jgi:GT2 family glycosyltransferase
MTKIAIIMLHYGAKKTTQHALFELKSKLKDNSLILVNNTSEDISDLAKIAQRTTLINNKQNLGFAKAVNQGLAVGLKDPQITHFLLLNNDLTLASGTLDQLLMTFNKVSSAGIVSPVLHHPQGYDWGGRYSRLTGMVRHRNWENKPKTIQKVEHVAGAAMLISREVLAKIGLFDERFFLYFEDLDYCLRASEAGFSIHINPDVVAEHQVSAGSSPIPRLFHQWRSHILFLLKYLPVKALPTALLYGSIFYPLVLFKLIIRQLFTKST